MLPESQRRTLAELSDDLDLTSGDSASKISAFWTMLTLSSVIATAGVLSDSTATVIGASLSERSAAAALLRLDGFGVGRAGSSGELAGP